MSGWLRALVGSARRKMNGGFTIGVGVAKTFTLIRHRFHHRHRWATLGNHGTAAQADLWLNHAGRYRLYLSLQSKFGPYECE